jgi:hypothetical protein
LHALITTALTFITTRIVYVVVATVVLVAAVPTVIIGIRGHTVSVNAGPVASASRSQKQDEQVRIILEVNQAGDKVIVALNAFEASCDANIAQLAGQSRLSADATAAALKKGRDDFHAAVIPFVDEVQADQRDLDSLRVITVADEQTYLARIAEIQVVAIGDQANPGALVTFCKTVMVEVQQVIVVQPPGGGGMGDDISH